MYRFKSEKELVDYLGKNWRNNVYEPIKYPRYKILKKPMFGFILWKSYHPVSGTDLILNDKYFKKCSRFWVLGYYLYYTWKMLYKDLKYGQPYEYKLDPKIHLQKYRVDD